MDEDEENYYSQCIEIAISAIQRGNYIKAEKFLNKAKEVNPSEEVSDLLQYISSITKKDPDSENIDIRQRHKTSNMNEENRSEMEYTNEQLEIVQKIKKCKDYYEVLGVKKDATDLEIKKAYKKLALQLHPDKNRAPGAVEAFKAIGNAVAILTDSQKRKEYDLFGLQTNENTRHHRYHHTNGEQSNFYMRQNNYEYAYGRGFEADISAEELFNIFFGGGFSQHESTIFNNYHHHRESNQQSSIAFGLILIFIIVSMLSTFLTSDPLYNLGQTSKYNVQRHTSHLGIPYYVKENFAEEHQGSLIRLENSIEEQYILRLKQNCYRERSYRESMIMRARTFGTQLQVAQAQSLKVPSCENLIKIGLVSY